MAQGVTSSTPGNLVIGAGVVFRDGSIVGASMDSNVFTIEQEFADIDLNGVPGKLMGTDYKTSEMASLQTTIPEVSSTIMSSMWPGSQSGTVGTVTTIDTDGSRRIPTADYHDPVGSGEQWLLQHLPFYEKWYRFWLFWMLTDGMYEGVKADPAYAGPPTAVSDANLMLRELLVEVIKP